MSLIEHYEWLDMLGELAFSSSEPFESRAFYATWWADLAYHLLDDDDEERNQDTSIPCVEPCILYKDHHGEHTNGAGKCWSA